MTTRERQLLGGGGDEQLVALCEEMINVFDRMWLYARCEACFRCHRKYRLRLDRLTKRKQSHDRQKANRKSTRTGKMAC